MRLLWSKNGWEDYQYWVSTDRNTLKRLNLLIKEIRRDPFKGRGKPEPLKGELRGWRSRRLTGEDRLVYRFSGQGETQCLEIIQCKGHY